MQNRLYNGKFYQSIFYYLAICIRNDQCQCTVITSCRLIGIKGKKEKLYLTGNGFRYLLFMKFILYKSKSTKNSIFCYHLVITI